MQVETIFAIDDDAAVRDSLAELGRAMGYHVECFAAAAEFLAAYDPDRPGCIVLDVRMPHMSGLELQEELRHRGSQLPIIIVTAHGDVPMSVSAIKAGAVDFLEKPFSPEELVTCIGEAIALDARQRTEKQMRNDAELLLEQLTAEERQVLLGVADGKTNSTIAAELDVSLRTVQFRRANIKKKLRIDTKSEMVQLVRRAALSEKSAERAPG